jgi:hypothetical protein
MLQAKQFQKYQWKLGWLWGSDSPIYFLSTRGMAQTSNGFALVGHVQVPYSYTGIEAVVVKISSSKVELDKYISKGELGFDSAISTVDGGFIVTGWSRLGE